MSVGTRLPATAPLRSLPPASRAATGRCTAEFIDLDLHTPNPKQRSGKSAVTTQSVGTIILRTSSSVCSPNQARPCSSTACRRGRPEDRRRRQAGLLRVVSMSVGARLPATASLRSLPPASRAATGRCTTKDFDLAFDLSARWHRRHRARRQGARPSAGVVEGDERQEAAKAVRARDGPSRRAPGTAPESREPDTVGPSLSQRLFGYFWGECQK
jgi:hypothetical protein